MGDSKIDEKQVALKKRISFNSRIVSYDVIVPCHAVTM